MGLGSMLEHEARLEDYLLPPFEAFRKAPCEEGRFTR